MKDRGVSKEPGISWIQIKNKLHYCLKGSCVLPDVEEKQKQADLIHHGEKLAIA